MSRTGVFALLYCPTMKTLRSMARLRWCVLAWFALYLGVAAASSIAQPKAMDVVCSSTGITKLLIHAKDGAVESGAAGMDCPLCLLAAAPPEPPQARLPAVPPLARQPLPSSCVHPVAAMAAPPPARAPPFSLSQS